MTGLPSSWAEVLSRLGRVLCDEAAAEEWVNGAVKALWGQNDPFALDLPRRSLALQKVSGVILALEEMPWDVAFDPNVRAVVGEAFSRYFNGAIIDGPPWRIAPSENDRPSYEEWRSAVDIFG